MKRRKRRCNGRILRELSSAFQCHHLPRQQFHRSHNSQNKITTFCEHLASKDGRSLISLVKSPSLHFQGQFLHLELHFKLQQSILPFARSFCAYFGGATSARLDRWTDGPFSGTAMLDGCTNAPPLPGTLQKVIISLNQQSCNVLHFCAFLRYLHRSHPLCLPSAQQDRRQKEKEKDKILSAIEEKKRKKSKALPQMTSKNRVCPPKTSDKS